MPHVRRHVSAPMSRGCSARRVLRSTTIYSSNAREPDGMAKVALKLGTYRKLNPTPLEEFIFFDHPSGRARIRMAMDWKEANLPAGESDASNNQPATH